MTKGRETAKFGLDALLKAGAEKAQCAVSLQEKHEMNVDAGEFSLLRTTFDTSVMLVAIKDGKKGTGVANKSDRESLEKAAGDVISMADASQPDEANDIAEKQPPEVFSRGPTEPDLDKMHFRLREFLETVKTRYPRTVIRQAYVDFSRSTRYFVNSNGVDFETSKGVYNLITIFSSRDGDKVSSFNYTGFAARDLDRPLIDCGSLDTLIRQSGEQVTTQSIKGKFVGDVIFTPDCLVDMLGFLVNSVGDGAMISGTSIYKDSLEKRVTSPLLTLHCKPTSEEISDGYFVTPDGYKAEDLTLVDRGVLKTYLLSLYGSRKTGKDRSQNAGGGWIIDSGETPYEEMVKSIKRGILLARFSGGYPSANGDFSGIAKNSYLIEDGEIKYPISESMVSGNFADMLMNVKAVSKERVDSGRSIFPWVAVSGATISGK